MRSDCCTMMPNLCQEVHTSFYVKQNQIVKCWSISHSKKKTQAVDMGLITDWIKQFGAGKVGGGGGGKGGGGCNRAEACTAEQKETW